MNIKLCGLVFIHSPVNYMSGASFSRHVLSSAPPHYNQQQFKWFKTEKRLLSGSPHPALVMFNHISSPSSRSHYGLSEGRCCENILWQADIMDELRHRAALALLRWAVMSQLCWVWIIRPAPPSLTPSGKPAPHRAARWCCHIQIACF